MICEKSGFKVSSEDEKDSGIVFLKNLPFYRKSALRKNVYPYFMVDAVSMKSKKMQLILHPELWSS